MRSLKNQVFIAREGEASPASHQLNVEVTTQNRDMGRHQVAFPEVRLIATGLNHPRHQPIHNGVQPFCQNQKSCQLIQFVIVPRKKFTSLVQVLFDQPNSVTKKSTFLLIIGFLVHNNIPAFTCCAFSIFVNFPGKHKETSDWQFPIQHTEKTHTY